MTQRTKFRLKRDKKIYLKNLRSSINAHDLIMRVLSLLPKRFSVPGSQRRSQDICNGRARNQNIRGRGRAGGGGYMGGGGVGIKKAGGGGGGSGGMLPKKIFEF